MIYRDRVDKISMIKTGPLRVLVLTAAFGSAILPTLYGNTVHVRMNSNHKVYENFIPELIKVLRCSDNKFGNKGITKINMIALAHKIKEQNKNKVNTGLGETIISDEMRRRSMLAAKQAQMITEKQQKPAISRGGRDLDYIGEFKATAYTPDTCGKSQNDKEYGVTRLGTVSREGVVAVDPKVIPLGTKLYIEGIGRVIAADTGGNIKGRRIDICIGEPHLPKKAAKKQIEQAKQFGTQKLQVYIIK